MPSARPCSVQLTQTLHICPLDRGGDVPSLLLCTPALETEHAELRRHRDALVVVVAARAIVQGACFDAEARWMRVDALQRRRASECKFPFSVPWWLAGAYHPRTVAAILNRRHPSPRLARLDKEVDGTSRAYVELAV
eukprot:CAMPEP_0174733114 /NCGR_PEP_ID=MMETSP1094-20130205/60669_1 /TAXON_ID=156173 /ORGANISM="Chrysochromulina brevifilum, Strain UTEX LB 985" /LENGTH=136 /DNA_ID=CAMNT_0015935731 /DNA_START=129 /DNA_END=536 /DNA_ORIENTATION=+